MTPLGTIKARRGQVRIDGPLGTLWELPIGSEVTLRDRYELTHAAFEYGHPVQQMLRAADAAAKAVQRQT